MPSLSTIGIGTFADIASGDDVDPSLLAQIEVLGIPVARVSAEREVSLAGVSELLSFEGPFVPTIDEPSEDNTQRVGTDSSVALLGALGDLAADPGLEVDLLGSLPLGVSQGQILSQTVAIVSSLLGVVDDALSPILQSTGLDVGGADVTILSVSAGRPRLVR